MTTPADPRGDYTQAPAIYGGTVKLLVGPKVVPFTVHQELIRSRAAFFDAALNKCWVEGRSGQVMMPEDNPDIIKLYVQYLYSGKIYLERTTTSAKLKSNDNLPEYIVLAEAYALGEQIQDFTFKDSVVNAILACTAEIIQGQYWYPITSAVDIIYRGTTTGSFGRQLMVELHMIRDCANFISDDQEVNNKYFLADLARAMVKAARQDARGTGFFPAPSSSIDARRYHEKVEDILERRMEIDLMDGMGRGLEHHGKLLRL
ncbi:hypothetical protein LTS10_002098 [Elasticomyces elasticus]|nr:hypothetical protein LTS10_002098 [Elasticomyces elasticus]